MAKPDLYNSSLLPFVLVAGILSGALWRSAAPPGEATPGRSPGTADKLDFTPTTGPWISDLRPAMDSIAAALGLGGSDSQTTPIPPKAALRITSDASVRNQAVLDEMARLRTSMDAGAGGAVCVGDSQESAQAAENLAATLLVDSGDAVKARNAAAAGLIDEFRNWRLLATLAELAKKSQNAEAPVEYDVNFLVATIPDYVDSNSGWIADQSLAAIQSGMTRNDYLFDRIKLIDWSRSGGDSATPVSNSRLHERQPGALIFRRVDKKAIHLQIVLLALETPTAGIHQVALRNSASFIRAWNACSGRENTLLRVLGPTFSGSIVSLATVLAEPAIHDSFTGRVVITGSANADENIERMTELSNGAIYRATIQPSRVIRDRIAKVLGSMNSRWEEGHRVALLVESNTAYGRSGSTSTLRTTGTTIHSKYFGDAAEFRFPLHIAQLRSDAPASTQPVSSLLPTAIIPLNMREAAPPSDLIPALRPQLTSAVVEATVDSILDAIRHEKYTAVGILATDDRDTLFLAREVKRTSPDTQLFLFGTDSLYLHPDYVPYLRGTLVASSYSLSLANQPEIGSAGRKSREPFQSMIAEGLFYATTAIISMKEPEDSRPVELPYCSPATPTDCVPVAPLSISVIGEDGYWPLVSKATEELTQESSKSAAQAPPAPPSSNTYPLPPLPGRTLIGLTLVGFILVGHLIVLFAIRRDLLKDSGSHPFLELPLVRVLAPPQTPKSFARYHKLAVRICFIMLALVAAWVLATLLPFWLPRGARGPLTALLCAFSFGGFVFAGIMWYGQSRAVAEPASPAADNQVGTGEREPSHWTPQFTICFGTGWLLFLGIVATMISFAIVATGVIGNAGNADGWIVLARLVGGGTVSPAALTICLIAAVYTGLLTGIRRLSLVGYGYKELSKGSRTFALLTGEPIGEAKEPAPTPDIAMILDMPAQHMPTIYPVLLLLALGMACIAVQYITAIDGKALAWFVRIGSLTGLGFGLWILAQGLATWNAARSHLKRLARSPIEPHFHEIASHIPWDITLAPPRLTEIMPVARRADRIIRNFRSVGFAVPYVATEEPGRRNLLDFLPFRKTSEQRVGLRVGDAADVKQLLVPPSHVDTLQVEMKVHQHAAIIQSSSWLGLWRFSDAIVGLLAKTSWQRAKPMETADVAAVVEAEAGTQWPAWQSGRRIARSGSASRPAAAHRNEADYAEASARESAKESKPAEPELRDSPHQDGWFSECSQLVALQIAFVLRDIVARTITCLFAAMVCLTLLTASHLLYSFNGRASMLTVDLLAVAAAALTAVWILVDMERDHVLSRLRTTTPGRIDLNWDFIKRIGVYGVLPLIAVIASLFPEIGGTLFGWLEPIRRLSNF